MIADWLHSKADFVTVQEAHVTNNRAAFLRQQLAGCDVEVFWSGDRNKPCSVGGILLIVRKSFLGRFEFQQELRNVTPGHSVTGGSDSVMGHAIGLRLQSRILGDLDIWAIYAPADTEVKRRKLWTTLLSNMKKDTLNVMAGDFNFVEHHGDRVRGDTHQFTGRGDSSEAKEFKRLITDRFDMVEIEQCMHTRVWGQPHKGLHSTSRLDRAYSSTAVGWAHLQESFCDMLPWRCNSDHYPLRFGARKIIEKTGPAGYTTPALDR
jgi:hypothetical protein